MKDELIAPVWPMLQMLSFAAVILLLIPMIMRIVSRQYFQAMGMRILEGRTFSEVGRAAYPELIVNQEFVRRYFPPRTRLDSLSATSRAIRLLEW